MKLKSEGLAVTVVLVSLAIMMWNFVLGGGDCAQGAWGDGLSRVAAGLAIIFFLSFDPPDRI